MSLERELMNRVDRIAGPLWEAISPEGHITSSIPKAYVMAVTATESGRWLIHNPTVPARFESSVYWHLLAVLEGRLEHYSGINKKLLAGLNEEALREYAQSWSLTQILGYHTLRWRLPLDYIRNPVNHYHAFIKLTMENCDSCGLDPAKDFLEMAEVWNSGRVRGSPDYGAKVIRRMGIWGELHAE